MSSRPLLSRLSISCIRRMAIGEVPTEYDYRTAVFESDEETLKLIISRLENPILPGILDFAISVHGDVSNAAIILLYNAGNNFTTLSYYLAARNNNVRLMRLMKAMGHVERSGYLLAYGVAKDECMKFILDNRDVFVIPNEVVR